MDGLKVGDGERVLRKRRPAKLRVERRRQALDERSGDDDSGDEGSSPSPTSSGGFPHSPKATESQHNELPPPPTNSAQPPPQSSVPPPPPPPPQTSSTSSLPSTTNSPSNNVPPAPTVQPIVLPSTTSIISGQITSSTASFLSISTTASLSLGPLPGTISKGQTKLHETSRVQSLSTSTRSRTTSTFANPQAIETGSKSPGEKTRAHTTLSHGATIALEVLGIITGIALLVGLAFVFYRRLKRKRQKAPSNQSPGTTPPSPTITAWSSPNRPTMSLAGRVNRFKNYLTPNKDKATTANVAPDAPDSVVGRAQRLDLVKPELLSEKHKNGTFMKGHQRSVTQDLALNNSLPTMQQPQTPRKALLPRLPLGKISLTSRAASRADDEEKLITRSGGEDDAKTFVHDRAGPVPLIKSVDGSIQPLTGWRAKLFWSSGKKNNKAARSRAISPEGSRDDPTLMSGGLRTSGMLFTSNIGQGQNGQDEVVNYVGNGGTLKGLQGLRGGDALIERGVDRQSFVSGMLEGSRTTWGTNVWERLDAERELREIREKMEGGMGGEVQLNGRESSVARYRRPMSWIEDQVERRPPMPEIGNLAVDGNHAQDVKGEEITK